MERAHVAAKPEVGGRLMPVSFGLGQTGRHGHTVASDRRQPESAHHDVILIETHSQVRSVRSERNSRVEVRCHSGDVRTDVVLSSQLIDSVLKDGCQHLQGVADSAG